MTIIVEDKGREILRIDQDRLVLGDFSGLQKDYLERKVKEAGEKTRPRLTEGQIDIMRQRYKSGGWTYTSLARSFGVSTATVARHVKEPS